jgi:PAS domain S-box-containing protein
MTDAVRPASQPRGRHIPLWDDHGQAWRFAGVLALAAVFAAIPYLAAGRLIVAAICAAVATSLTGLCAWSSRGGPRWVLGLGTPLTMTLGALALLAVTAGTCVASAALLALVPAVAVLWGGSERVGWCFLAATLAGSVAVLWAAPEEVVRGAEPWIADARAPWLIGPLALALFLLARSWAAAHGAWQDEVIATHAVVAASEARFKAYVENAHDVTAELDARGRVLFVTAKKSGHYALPLAELLGTKGGDYIHPDDLPAARRVFEAAATGRARVSEPIRYRGAREGWRYLRVAVNSYRTHEGKLRFVLQARDETALVETQLERDRRVAELEAALARSEALLSQGACPRSGEGETS